MAFGIGYLRATRHPWPCLLFLLPLLVGYEVGVIYLGGAQPATLRNGADNWVRCHLLPAGSWLCWLPPLVLILIFSLWSWRRWQDRPNDLVGVLSGVLLESVGFALGLWGLSRALGPLMEHVGVGLAAGEGAEAGFRQVVRYLGSGIYEEAIFRLVLFSLLLAILWRFHMQRWVAMVVAALISAILFSAAHHWGPNAEQFTNYKFLFRVIAGLYFAFLFQGRGFAVAVGSHACYNVMVSIGSV